MQANAGDVMVPVCLPACMHARVHACMYVRLRLLVHLHAHVKICIYVYASRFGWPAGEGAGSRDVGEEERRRLPLSSFRVHPYRCAREMSPGVDARYSIPHHEVVRWRHGRSAAGAETRGDSGELRPLHLRVPVREVVEGRARREGKEKKRGIYVALKISSETMRSVTPRATPRQTVVLPRFLLPLSVLASGGSSPFRLASFPLRPLLVFFSRASFSSSPAPRSFPFAICMNFC